MSDEQCDQTAASARSIELCLRDIVSDRKITNEHTTHVRSVSKYHNFDSLINITCREEYQAINNEIASMRTGAASPITLLGVYAQEMEDGAKIVISCFDSCPPDEPLASEIALILAARKVIGGTGELMVCSELISKCRS